MLGESSNRANKAAHWWHWQQIGSWGHGGTSEVPLPACQTQRTEEQGAGGGQVWSGDPWGPGRMRAWATHWHARPEFTTGERGARWFDKRWESGHLSKPSVIWQRCSDKWDKGELQTKVDRQIRQAGQRFHSGGPVIWCVVENMLLVRSGVTRNHLTPPSIK